MPAGLAGQNGDRPRGRAEATSGSTAWLCQRQRQLRSPLVPAVHPEALGLDLHLAAPATPGPSSTNGLHGYDGGRSVPGSVKIMHVIF